MSTNKESKKCFIVMPISDQDGYEKGHFTRVYNHIIKPACEKAGFEAIRADDEVKTNYIALDIVKKIIESDIVLCDLSSKNPNVLYELGIRQAFNKKVVLIKDKKTGRIFDIQGFRTVDYDENLRIDEVEKAILSISNTLKETSSSKEGEINSFVQLLSIKPAEITSNIKISQESSIILDMLENISSRISNIEEKKSSTKSLSSKNTRQTIIGNQKFRIGDFIFSELEKDEGFSHIGDLLDFDDESIIIKNDDEIIKLNRNDKVLQNVLSI